MPDDYFSGRGAQINTPNPYLNTTKVTEHPEGLDEPLLEDSRTQFLMEYPKKVLNKVESPDIPLAWSTNPYQGCEHGCVYCYARNTHHYWGYSAGLDFERKIIVKPEAPKLLERELQKMKRKPEPIMLSGNTDCYQPAEKKFKLTRKILEILLKYKHPVGIITKNSLVLRDIDILSEMSKHQLVSVSLSINSLNEEVRRKLEPRTATAARRLTTIEKLSAAGIPVNVMIAPVIPGLTSEEIPAILKATANRGAHSAGYSIVRLNGYVGDIFSDWIHKNFPDRAAKVLNQVEHVHGGKLGDSRFGTRMRGEGKIAESIGNLFKLYKKKYFGDRKFPILNQDAFCPAAGKQLGLF